MPTLTCSQPPPKIQWLIDRVDQRAEDDRVDHVGGELDPLERGAPDDRQRDRAEHELEEQERGRVDRRTIPTNGMTFAVEAASELTFEEEPVRPRDRAAARRRRARTRPPSNRARRSRSSRGSSRPPRRRSSPRENPISSRAKPACMNITSTAGDDHPRRVDRWRPSRSETGPWRRTRRLARKQRRDQRPSGPRASSLRRHVSIPPWPPSSAPAVAGLPVSDAKVGVAAPRVFSRVSRISRRRFVPRVEIPCSRHAAWPAGSGGLARPWWRSAGVATVRARSVLPPAIAIDRGGRRPARPSARGALAWKPSRKSSSCPGRGGRAAAAGPRRGGERERVAHRRVPPADVFGYSSSAYWQSWIRRSASHARSKPEIHSGFEVREGRHRAPARGRGCNRRWSRPR